MNEDPVQEHVKSVLTSEGYAIPTNDPEAWFEAVRALKQDSAFNEAAASQPLVPGDGWEKPLVNTNPAFTQGESLVAKFPHLRESMAIVGYLNPADFLEPGDAITPEEYTQRHQRLEALGVRPYVLEANGELAMFLDMGAYYL